MSRAVFVYETINLWKEAQAKMIRDGYDRAAEEMKIAISVLEKTYTPEELISEDD